MGSEIVLYGHPLYYAPYVSIHDGINSCVLTDKRLRVKGKILSSTFMYGVSSNVTNAESETRNYWPLY